MKTIFWRTIPLLILVLVAVKVFSTTTAKAAPQDTFGVCTAQVPRDWGQFKGGSEQTGIAFEDAKGTIRFVTTFPCNGAAPLVALQIKRTPGN